MGKEDVKIVHLLIVWADMDATESFEPTYYFLRPKGSCDEEVGENKTVYHFPQFLFARRGRLQWPW